MWASCAKNDWTDRDAVWVVDSNGPKAVCVTWRILAQPGECDWTVRALRRFGLFVKLLWPLVHICFWLLTLSVQVIVVSPWIQKSLRICVSPRMGAQSAHRLRPVWAGMIVTDGRPYELELSYVMTNMMTGHVIITRCMHIPMTDYFITYTLQVS